MIFMVNFCFQLIYILMIDIWNETVIVFVPYYKCLFIYEQV